MTVGAHRGRLVGRHQERQLLADALRTAESGEPRALIVTGDAGIGKTRLVEEVIRQLEGRWLVASGHCVEAGPAGLPYAPLSGILGAVAATAQGARLLDDAASAAPGLLPLVGGEVVHPPVDTTSGLSQLRLFDALVRLLGELSGHRPTMVVIEDLHWADSSTRAFLSFLCRNLMPRPLVVLVTARTDELHRKHPLRLLLGELARLPAVTSIELGGLDTGELGELLAGHHGAPVPRNVVDSIARRSGGNPFFAEQLWVVGAGQADTRPTIELADVLLHRVDRLSDEAQHLLRAASLAGQRIEHGLLLAVAGQQESAVTAALRECADVRLFEPEADGGAYRFRHALLAEVIAADAIPTERRSLHARFADALAGNAPAAVVARHCLGAADLPG
ncbi:MAG: ATP-binding protein, partial [Haloechinothrix sp.]